MKKTAMSAMRGNETIWQWEDNLLFLPTSTKNLIDHCKRGNDALKERRSRTPKFE